MKRLLPLTLTAFAFLTVAAVADLSVKDGGGVTRVIKNYVCETTKLCNATVLIKSDGTEVGISSAPLRVDPTGTTPQPVSGTVAATGTFWPYNLGQQLSAESVPVVLPAAQISTLTPPAAITGFATSVKQSDGTQKTQIVDGAGAVIASTSNNLNVQCANCSGSGVSTADAATFTASTSLFAGTGGFFQTTATANPLTNGQQGMWQMTATRAGFVNLRDTAGTAIGTSAAEVFVGGRGTAGSAAGGVLTVQGVASMTPLFMQSATVPVSTMNSASANSGMNAALSGVFDDTSPTAITENSFGFLRMSANRNLYGTIRDAAGNERGANVDASNRLTTAASLISGAVASGAYASGAFASGSFSSGAFASGSYASGAFATGSMVDLLTVIGTKNAGTASASSLLAGGVYNSTPLTLTNTQQSSLQLDANGYLKTTVTNTNNNGQVVAGSSSPVVVAKNSGTGSTVAGAAIGTAGTASTEVVTVQGVASMTPVQVSQATASNLNAAVVGTGTAGTAAGGVLTVQGVASMTPFLANPGTAANWGVGATAAAVPASANYIGFNSGGNLTAPAVATPLPVRPGDGTRNAIVDPCEANLQSPATGVITSATTTRIIAPSASNKTYLCVFFTKASVADNVAVVEGTGGTCGTGTAAVLGGTTTANGLVFTAGDGVLLQAGGKVAVLQTTGTNVDLCLITSTAGPLIWSAKYVQAP